MPFQFNDDQAYALEFADEVMRPLALGGAVLEDLLHVTAITNAAQAQITAALHGYSVGDPVYLTSIEGMVEINDRFLTVASVIDANNFTVNFDSTAAGVFTGDVGGITRTAPPAAPPSTPATPAPAPAPDPTPVASGSAGGYTSGGQWKGFGSDTRLP